MPEDSEDPARRPKSKTASPPYHSQSRAPPARRAGLLNVGWTGVWDVN